MNYEFSTDIEKQLIFIDLNKIEQVLVNIISNAFKYSNKKGSVRVTISNRPDSLVINVEDKGKGLTKEDQEHLFERFYTGNKNLSFSGFGIGLNLSKEYIELHDGIINVESQPGEYTLLSIVLFKDINHYSKKYIFEESCIQNSHYHQAEINSTLVSEKLSQFYNYKILVVEDDPDVRSYLRKELSGSFDIETADNGNEALNILDADKDITLIVSDVLMPEMNGFQLSHQLKNDIAFSHIPIILLTALSDDSQRIYGIAEGADEYIQKPFNIDFLKIRIINIIQERQRMKDVFMEKLQAGFLDNSDINNIVSIDDLFRYKLLETIEKSYENSDFSIEELSELIGLSRVHLYRKIKTLFGISPTDFLRNYRLNKALILLKQKHFAISEIAYMTGFTSPAYFTKCFKTFYSVTPSEYITSVDTMSI
jgi:DNA-binding response OmpR family regulator